MSCVPALSYFELLAYTGEETRRWRAYFDQNPKALEVSIGGERKDVRGLVTHLFISEYRWGQYLVRRKTRRARFLQAAEHRRDLGDLRHRPPAGRDLACLRNCRGNGPDAHRQIGYLRRDFGE